MSTTAPDARDLPSLIAKQRAAAPAVCFEDAELTYGELAARVREATGRARALGVRHGDAVGLLAPNSVEWLVASAGMLAAGARVFAFHTWARAWDLEYLLGHSRVGVLLAARGFARHSLLDELRKLVPEAWAGRGAWRSERFPSLERLAVLDPGDVPPGAADWSLLDGAADDEPVALGANETAFVLYTSGSTAHPKAVPLRHGHLVENGYAIGERMRLTAADRVWLGSPLFWSFGIANAVMATFSHGACLVLEPSFDAARSARVLRDQRCTAAYLLPAIAEALAGAAADTVRAATELRTGVTIGRPDELRRIAEELDVPEICNIYGSTETYGNCCVCPRDEPLGVRLDSQGPPLDGVELRIADPEGVGERPPGQDGEIQVRGRVTPGYLGDAEATAAAFTADGFYRTGDHGHVDERGFLHFSGRATEMIKTSGINVSPAEVERFLARLDGVTEVAVVGAPHPVKGEAVVAFVQPQDGVELRPAELIAVCRESIASYKVPEIVVLRDALPRTGTGKLHRRALAEEAPRLLEAAP